MNKILVVDDKQMMRDSVAATLQRAGYQVVTAGDGATAVELLARHRPAAVVTDLKMPEMDGLELLGRLRAADEQLPVVIMTAYGTVGDAVRAIKIGAFDFIQKPFEGDQLVLTVKRAVEHRQLVQENAALRTAQPQASATTMLIGKSVVMRQVAQQIQQVARSSGTVLIHGESGTGKEVVARAIHALSPRRERVMLAVNCAALSSNLLESELFGHERGSFTGADQLRKGRFELADGGTLLLDEISEIGPELQAKLLRVLQEQQFERVGSSYTTNVDVRVIATTNRDLTRSVAEGAFRQDLYYRLNVLPVQLPPLRARLEDVPLLADHFLQQLALREGREAKVFEDTALEMMQRYTWPGNVRELQNICERASVLSREHVIPMTLIAPWLGVTMPLPAHPVVVAPWGEISHPHSGRALGGGGVTGAYGTPAAPASYGGAAAHAAGGTHGGLGSGGTLEEMERQQILHTLGQYHGNRTRTAKALGIGVRTLGLKLKKWKEQNLVAQNA